MRRTVHSPTLAAVGALFLLLFCAAGARADTGLALDTGNIPQHAYWYGNYGSAYPGCVNQGFQPGQFAPDAAPPDPGPCGNYTQTNTTLELHFQAVPVDASAIVSLDLENPSRTGWGYVTINGVSQGNMAFADHAAESWISFPAVTVHAGDDLGVVVKTNYSGQTGRFTLHTAHAALSDLPVVYGAPGSFWRTPVPSTVTVNQTASANLQAELAGEVTSTNKAAVNSGAWTQPVYRFDPGTPRVSVWLWRSSFGTAQPKYVKPRQTQLNVGDPASLTGVPDPDLLGWQPAPAPDTDQEFVAICAKCSSPDGAYTGYDVELWKFHRCTASDLTYAPSDPATGAPYVWCAGEGGRDTGTDQSAGHPVTDYQGYPYGTWPDPFTDPLHVSKYEDKGDLATATSLPNAAGEVTEADVRAGQIDHPIGFSLIYPVPGHVWPAQRDDGWASAPHAVKEGERFFLPASTDCTAATVPAPLGRLVCEALKTYGGVLWDKAGAFSMRVEPAVKTDPVWAGIGGSSQLDGIDWSHVQVIGDEATGSYGTDTVPFP